VAEFAARSAGPNSQFELAIAFRALSSFTTEVSRSMPVTRSVGEEQPERKREERRELRVDELLRALSLQ